MAALQNVKGAQRPRLSLEAGRELASAVRGLLVLSCDASFSSSARRPAGIAASGTLRLYPWDIRFQARIGNHGVRLLEGADF